MSLDWLAIWPLSIAPRNGACVPSSEVRRSENRSSAPDDEPASERTRRVTLTETLWGLDWRAHLPYTVCSGVIVHASTLEESLPFVRAHYASIFCEDVASPFSAGRVTAAKE